jgi:regulator of protease activity HflC (stomatin/prohibitin superfamily)
MFDRILDRCIDFLISLRNFVLRLATGLRHGAPGALGHAGVGLARARAVLITVAAFGLAGFLAWEHPPVQTVPRGEIAVRSNLVTGRVNQFGEGSLWVLPGLHQVRHFSIRDQVYRPEKSSKASGEAPFQSIEGLSLGVDLAVRYAIDPAQISRLARSLPDDYAGEIVEPAVQGVIYPLFARYTVREIFSSKRSEIQQAIEAQLRPRLAADGILLKSVQMGQVDLPQDYRNGMDKLLAEELESEKMRFTLELMDKRVQQTALEGEAEKVRRQKAAEAAGDEQVIAAKAQEEAMKHVLPFKKKQIEQRGLEAEADKVARVRQAEANADARRIEASGEADSRQKLADAEVYRLERVNRVNSEQMEREGALISQNPLLIQKTLADKLSDKVQVIIAPPPASGGFIGSTLLGGK